MISKATVSYARISPRKVRYVIDQIRRKDVPQAWAILSGSPRRASGIVRKLLDQAVDAAEKNSQIPAQDLVVSKVLADGGPTMYRYRAATMGRANIIRKRTSHITLELDLAKHAVNRPAAKPPAKRSASKKGPELKGPAAGAVRKPVRKTQAGKKTSGAR